MKTDTSRVRERTQALEFQATDNERHKTMANNIGTLIAASCSFGISYAERLLRDVAAADFARFARPGGQTVESNHPAFIFGHLSLYGPRIIGDLGGDLTAVRSPDSFQCLFSKSAKCQDDPGGTIYPNMDTVVDKFLSNYRAAEEMLRGTDDATFLQENLAGGRLTELFPTIGAMHAFYVSGHFMGHLGQMSAWRRMMGMEAA